LPARAEQPCSLLVDRLALADALIRRRALTGVEIDQIIGRELRPSTVHGAMAGSSKSRMRITQKVLVSQPVTSRDGWCRVTDLSSLV
jgi:hypothetical protein